MADGKIKWAVRAPAPAGCRSRAANGSRRARRKGLVGGVKIGRSPARLPLQVITHRLLLTDAFLARISRHLIVIYTGKTRLARNLLQGVVRNWYARLPDMMRTIDELTCNAESCAEALQLGTGVASAACCSPVVAADAAWCAEDIARVGACLSRYWELKKTVAPGAEPPLVRALMGLLAPLAYGQGLAGAGGGGFLAVLMREPDQIAAVQRLLDEANQANGCHFTIHRADIASEGLCMTLADGAV